MKTRIVTATATLAVSLTLVASARQAVTLEALLSVPFPSEIVAAPQGGRVAWIENAGGARNVWIATAPDFTARQLTAYMRGQARDLRWSPDGSTLAFVSARGDHSFIGTYERATKTLRYLDPSIDLDGNPVWSPDGSRIAFTRIPATGENFMFAPRREGLPWSIRTVEVASGRATETWRAGHGPGSVFQGVNASSQLHWTASDRLVFPWERRGWIQLYSVPAGGGSALHLTPGEFEVEHVAMTPDRRAIVYSSNQVVDGGPEAAADIDRRHIWRVSADGSTGPVALTRGTGAEWMPAPIDNETIAHLRSTGVMPAHAAVRTATGQVALSRASKDLAVDQLVVPERVTFTAIDGMIIPAQRFRPRDLKSGERRPAVLFFHGGSRRQMLIAWHYLSYYHNTYAMNQYLASRGYLVLSVNYRSGTGYGLNFREAGCGSSARPLISSTAI